MIHHPLRRALPAAVAALTICAVTSALPAKPLAAADLVTDDRVDVADTKLPEELLTHEGSAIYYDDGDGKVTGFFSLSPNFLLGDVNGDSLVNASDASLVLVASTLMGTGNDAETAWRMAFDGVYMPEELATRFGDTDGSGSVDAADASDILVNSVETGVGNARPIGTVDYCADEDGYLHASAFVLDSASGKLYHTNADYTVTTGAFTYAGGSYLTDEDGALYTETWVDDADGRVYYGEDGAKVTNALLRLDDGVFYVDADGHPLTGRQSLAEGEFLFGDDGAAMTGWINADNAVYYAREDGALVRSFQQIDGATYYFFNDSYRMAKGWVNMAQGKLYFLPSSGAMATGLCTVDGTVRYFAADGVMQIGLVTDGETTYLFDGDGAQLTGMQNVDGRDYYFDPETGAMATGWVTSEDGTRYCGQNGEVCIGWTDIGGTMYYFRSTGVMVTGDVPIDGKIYRFGDDGAFQTEVAVSNMSVKDQINTYSAPMKMSMPVHNVQKDPMTLDFTLYLRDEDIANIEAFAAEHFTDDMTLYDKLYTVHQWIHYENEYAYAGAKWNEICNLTYTDAIFNHKKGQCVQYNGAMALFLAYYGFDVYMVRGWTNPGVQHYWTEVNLGGKVYVVECGNSGKNGDWWQSFFKEIDGLGQAYYTGK